ncbi:hypothetical protein CEXT_214951 [Caerostris extrusa]|uniref:Uncharacterized protein n=1 Tax=Caerostris extrusa TaxID=172846 RepID=A0AAV4M8E2_CAEEX|nr:hypothetical protein CEXT_214951 [Caerostris extrusa]
MFGDVMERFQNCSESSWMACNNQITSPSFNIALAITVGLSVTTKGPHRKRYLIKNASDASKRYDETGEVGRGVNIIKSHAIRGCASCRYKETCSSVIATCGAARCGEGS